MAESASDIRITRDTPYLALTGELWGVYCEDFGENLPRYNGTALYDDIKYIYHESQQLDQKINHITCTHDDPVHWRINASQAPMG